MLSNVKDSPAQEQGFPNAVFRLNFPLLETFSGPMRRLPAQTLIEWIFVVGLVVVCALLSAFQYHWSGEVSRVTAERLRSSFEGQAQLLGRAFDSALLDACNQLLPDNEPLSAASREAVHAAHLRRWQARQPRPVFRRIAVAVPEKSALQCYLLDQKTARVSQISWPPEWDRLRDNLARKAAAGSGPPFQDPTCLLIEFPIFRDHLENEWMIFELDRRYIAKTWLPDLVLRFLNQNEEGPSDVTVQAFLRPEDLIYTIGAPLAEGDARTASVRFNGQGWGTETRNRRGEDDFWVLTARQRPVALEAIVSAARWRSLLLACLLNLLTLSAGFALLRYARRSRRVAALHMRFVANASHELRTPLTVIQGAGQNLVRGVTNDPGRIAQYGRFIVQHADQLNHLVERMLELADVRRLAASPERLPVSVKEALEGAVAATLADTRAAGCKVEVSIFSRLPNVKGDSMALRSVFQNLIGNAAKYAASGGWIGVKAELRVGGTTLMVEVRIEDHGPGIPEAEQARIFEPFARGASTRAEKIQGSGLGLSMVQEIVEAHHGTISVRSAVGRGTTFVVCLPALPEKRR